MPERELKRTIDVRKKKPEEEKEAAKRFKEETEKNKEKEKIVEMPQNAQISCTSFLRCSAPKKNGKPHHKSSDNGGSSSEDDDSKLSSTSLSDFSSSLEVEDKLESSLLDELPPLSDDL